ncbi:MAG: haloacid dehalogenase [Chloroflexi bacterium]|uniref:Haloacid dehalogenase n=1 Tax=Candidatus Thermofonsia Clade 3 bacterium TaxID=2364212 RepID=A0A2M8QFX3_9CHLR|nr:haloacid dehalogenase [Candidatus Roseilinea sp. NK_OTU-006]PJF48711.1 MAG: haloacid dehalogenase [Candidatus Thermofonsia Clade 3 bacterium]RMG64143.1 MAG: haloacid dehalogenase [Chloroflexota bacterium]
MADSPLAKIGERIRENLLAKNAARDRAVNLSRELIRYCSLAIRASHRDEWDEADRLLGEARRAADELVTVVQPYPDLCFSGYTQDALKELAEAHIALAIAQNKTVPAPEEIGVEYAAYLNGLAEAAGELRRRVLDEIRGGHSQEAERLLAAMDEIYDVLVMMDFPEAITGGLRRNTDMVRGVLERTRSDLTVSFRESELKAAIDALREKLN